jgi:hypothetical protein
MFIIDLNIGTEKSEGKRVMGQVEFLKEQK